MKGSFHNVATLSALPVRHPYFTTIDLRARKRDKILLSQREHASYLCTTRLHIPTARKQKHEENQEISSSKKYLIQKRSAATVELKLLSNAPVLFSHQNSISLFMRLLSGG
jgi:hypothetical protein